MKYTICIAVLAVLLSAAVPALAGGSGRIGTAGAQELRIPIGARGTALGGSVLADVSGVEALYWNPAGVVAAEKREAMFSHLNYLADMDVNYFGVTTKVADAVALGLSVKTLSVGDIIVTTELNPEGTGETFSPNFAVIGFTYAHQLTDRVAFGATAKYLDERIKRETAKGVAFDFGFQYAPPLTGLKLAIAMKNFGPDVRFDGPDLDHNLRLPGTDPQAGNRTVRTELAGFELPASIEMGASYDLVQRDDNRATVAATFRGNNLSENEYQVGVEYALQKVLFLRGGYTVSPEEDTTPSGFEKEYIFGPSFGFGLHFPLGSTDVAVDYSQAVVTDFFDDNRWITVTLGF